MPATPPQVRITHLDGKLPNLALMRLSAYHKAQGDRVHFTRRASRDLFEPDYQLVYGSSIFTYSEGKRRRLRQHFPQAVIGGTGTDNPATLDALPNTYDYSIYPDYNDSIGFLTRGCRLRCKFCVVPQKEGKPAASMSVEQLWRGPPYPKHLNLLDNDFFGAENWQGHVREIVDGGFKICLSQGINVRLITEEAAEALAAMEYRDTRFKRRRLYTAWDSLGQEAIFFRGVERLARAGIPTKHLMVYMLTGYAPNETMADVLYRFNKMADAGILPYPMVYDLSRKDLRAFQRWAVTGLYRAVPWEEYRYNPKRVERLAAPEDDLISGEYLH